MSTNERSGRLARRALAAARCVCAGWVLIGAAGTSGCFVAPPKPSQNRAMLGQLAPDLRLEWIDGAPIGMLSDLRGKVVLIEFWRTWCPACAREVPYLNELHGRYQGDGLTVVGVTNEEEAAVKTAVADLSMSYRVARTPDPQAERSWGITAVPRAFLVDREGTLVWAGHPGALEEGRLRELLYGP